MTDSLLGDPQAPESVRFDDLVGPDKKFKTSDDLARSKIEADRFIDQIKAENEQFRTELRARTNLEELADRISKGPNGELRTPPQEPARRQDDNAPAPTDLKSEVKRLLDEERGQASRQANLDAARLGAKERFGGDYTATLRQIAEELSVTDKFLTDIAASSPAAFLKLIDSVRAPDKNIPSAPPQSSLDTSRNFSSQNRKNNAFYSEMRKKDPNLYFAKRTQNEMHREALAQGQKFYE